MNNRILQIVQYSDIHLAGDDYIAQRWRLNRFNRLLPRNQQQGLAGADRDALLAFGEFLAQEIATDPDWSALPLWLVDTGDGTTFGDAASLQEWSQLSVHFRNQAGKNARQLVLYGNHDAWPGTHPILAPRQMETQRDALRQHWFADTLPTPPLVASLPNGGGSSIQLYALNSVDHRAVQNALALGAVLPDRFWEAPGGTVGPTAADDLGRVVAAHAQPGGGRHLRLLAMHYPVNDAATVGNPGAQKVLANRRRFTSEMATPRHGVLPMAHLFLAGHTHVGHPEIGLLPQAASSAHMPPLDPGQLQLVAGSLSQEMLYPMAPPANSPYPALCLQAFPYQCTVLRFFNSPTNPHEITVERGIAACAAGGDFAFLPLSANGSSKLETTTFLI